MRGENATAVSQQGQTGRIVMWCVWLSVSPIAFADLLHMSCSWNRWRCSWRRSTKTSRKCCAREESWSAECWTSRTRFSLCSVFLPYNARAHACIHARVLLTYCWLAAAFQCSHMSQVLKEIYWGRRVFQVSQRDVETEKRLKKDLKRTKVLLADAQIMLDHLKSNAPSKREIAQLKNQVGHSLKRLLVLVKLIVWLSEIYTVPS